MRLTFKVFDGRQKVSREIIDKDTGNKVGFIQCYGTGFGTYCEGIEVCPFGGRYWTNLHTHGECWGFVKGVEAALNQMTSTRAIVAKDTLVT
jgi:hypothetical protein